MQPIVLGVLPDEILHWRGTAAALAEQCNALLPRIGLAEDVGSANERLVRHYVQIGVLTPPEREGREALFDERHIRQFLAARYLLKDGWSLTKITELVRAAGPDRLTMFVPGDRAPTEAERALARLKVRATPASRPVSAPVVRESTPGIPAYAAPPESISDPLLQAAAISQRRMTLQSSLTGLGNTSGLPVVRRTVSIELTPWCQVHVDAAELERLPAETAELLGSALAQALHEERIRRGEKP